MGRLSYVGAHVGGKAASSPRPRPGGPPLWFPKTVLSKDLGSEEKQRLREGWRADQGHPAQKGVWEQDLRLTKGPLGLQGGRGFAQTPRARSCRVGM